MSKKRLVDQEGLKYAVEGIVASGKVVNGQLLARLIGVNKSTICRNLRQIGIIVPRGKVGWVEPSQDDEPRHHDEIARAMQEAISMENPCKPLSDPKLMVAIDFRGEVRNFTKIRNKYGIPSSRQRKRR